MNFSCLHWLISYCRSASVRLSVRLIFFVLSTYPIWPKCAQTSNVLYKIQWKLYNINGKLQSTKRKSRIQVQIIEYKCKIIEWKKNQSTQMNSDQILQRLTWHWNCALKLFNRFSGSNVTRYWVKPMFLMAWHNSSLRCGHTMRFCIGFAFD